MRPGKRHERRRAGAPGDLQERRLRPPPRRARRRRRPFEAMVARRVATITGDVSTDGLGLDDADRATFATCDIVIHSAAAVAFDSPLDCAVEINLLGPTRIVDPAERARRHAPPRRRPHVLRRRQPPRHARRRSSSARARSTSASTGEAEVAAARRLRSDTEAEQPAPRDARPASAARPATSSARPARRRWPPRPSSVRERLGHRPAWSRPAGHEPPASAGPTRTRTPRRSASRRSWSQGRRARSRSCDRRSSSRRWPSRGPAGSAASAWPSR